MLGGIATGLLVAGGVLLWTASRDEPADLPEVTFGAALQAIDDGKVAQVHMNDGTREATLVLDDGKVVVTVYPERSGAELVESARAADAKLTATRAGGDDDNPFLYAFAGAVAAGGLATWLLYAMDRRGIWHTKDTWFLAPRLMQIQSSVDRLEASVAALERRLDAGRTEDGEAR